MGSIIIFVSIFIWYDLVSHTYLYLLIRIRQQCCQVYPGWCPVVPCIILQFLTMPNVWSLNEYYYLFIKNINIKVISNQKIIINIFISVLIDIISSQTCHFFSFLTSRNLTVLYILMKFYSIVGGIVFYWNITKNPA